MATHPTPSEDGSARHGWGAWLRRRLGLGGRGGGEQPAPVRQASMERGHEPENTSESIGGILAATVVLVIAVAVVIAGLNVFVGFLGTRGTAPAPETRVTSAEAAISDAPPRPRLQVDPAVDLQAMHRAEYERLHTYGRVDSARLHIPIGRAMQLLVRRGLPADSAGPDSTADTLRIPTESGFRAASPRFPGFPRSQPFLGSSPEPYVPAPALRRRLTEDGYLPRIDSLRRNFRR